MILQLKTKAEFDAVLNALDQFVSNNEPDDGFTKPEELEAAERLLAWMNAKYAELAEQPANIFPKVSFDSCRSW